MKKCIKITVAITAVSLLMTTILFANGKKDAGQSETASDTSDTSPITFTFFTSDSSEDMPFTDPVAQEITKKTGVTLDVSHPVAGDTQDAIPLMLASGDYPDLIYAKGDLTRLIEAGAVIPLDDYIEKYGRNMKKLYGDQLVRLKNSTDDPHIYSAGTYGVHEKTYSTTGTMQLQHAVLKDLGYPKMETLDDYENALKAYIKKYPEINGKETIGLSLLIDTWQWYIDLSNPGGWVIGQPDNGQWFVNQKTYQAEYKFLDPEIYQWYKWLNKINAEGLLDPESFTQKEDIWQSKIASGRVLGIAYPTWGYNDSRSTLIASGMPERTYAYLPIVASKKYKCAALYDFGYSGGWGVAISTKCKDPVRAFKFLDWMCTDEAQVLVNWGIKDVNYSVIDGKRVVSEDEHQKILSDPDYARKTGSHGRWAYPFPEAGTAVYDDEGPLSFNSKDAVIAQYLPVEKETLAAYGAEMWTDLFPSPEALGETSKCGAVWQYTLPQDLNEKLTSADDYVKTALAQIVLCKPEEFDGKWAAMQQKLKDMGMEEAGIELTQLIHEKMVLWGTAK